MRWLKILVTGGVALLLSAASAEAAEKNLLELHAQPAKSNKQCLACHAGVTKVSAANKACKKVDKACRPLHKIHLQSKLATPKLCADCHSATDLRNGSAGALRKQVDPQICAGCHSGDIKGAKTLYKK